MKILVFGGTGLVGSEFSRRLAGDEVTALGSRDVDIVDSQRVLQVIRETEPDAVVNCAAIANPDQCEQDPDLAFRVNALGARNIAAACQETGCKCVYLSTDHIFNGFKGEAYTEFDSPSPMNVYGYSKLAGEQYTLQLCSRSFVVRTSILFGIQRDTLVTRCLKEIRAKGQVEAPQDQVVSPTYVKDLILWIRQLLDTPGYGIRHLTNQGSCTRYEMVREVLRLAGYDDSNIIPTLSDFSGKARRPLSVVIRNYVTELEGSERPRHWREALKEFIEEEQQHLINHR